MNSEIDTVILKCETQKTFQDITKKSNVWELLLSVATTYSYNESKYKIWSFSKKDELLKYLHKKNVVCYNGVRFDMPLLFGADWCCDPTFICHSKKHSIEFCCTDLFLRIMMSVYRCNTYDDVRDKMHKHPLTNMQAYSLYNVCVATLSNISIDKTSFDYKSNELFKTKKVLELVEFNLMKLRLIKKLYEYIMEFKQIINGDYDILKVKDVYNPDQITINQFLPF